MPYLCPCVDADKPHLPPCGQLIFPSKRTPVSHLTCPIHGDVPWQLCTEVA